MRLEPAQVHVAGDGFELNATGGRPSVRLYSGGYDSRTNRLCLASVIGHPRGVTLAGGEPVDEYVSGLRLFATSDQRIYWATDSMSLPRALTAEEAQAVQKGIEAYFSCETATRIEKLEDIFEQDD